MVSECTIASTNIRVGLSSFGGTLTSIKDADGLEYLWQGSTEHWTGQAPILFPICGSLREDKAMLVSSGKMCHMPRHGIVRKLSWELEDAAPDSCTYLLESTDETYQQFSYHFILLASYKVENSTLKINYTVCNTSKEPMPYFIGAHPGFRCPLFATEDYSDYYLEFDEPETLSVPTPITETGLIQIDERTPFLNHQKTLKLDHSLFHKDMIILDELTSKAVTLRSKKHDKALRLSFADFRYLMLWSSTNDGPFIALEPWNGLSTCNDEADVFEHKRNISILEPGQQSSYNLSIELI